MLYVYSFISLYGRTFLFRISTGGLSIWPGPCWEKPREVVQWELSCAGGVALLCMCDTAAAYAHRGQCDCSNQPVKTPFSVEAGSGENCTKAKVQFSKLVLGGRTGDHLERGEHSFGCEQNGFSCVRVVRTLPPPLSRTLL